MNVAVVGTGYVGLVSGACFAEMGVHVTCVDIDEAKIESLRNGNIPIYEPGLDEMVKRNANEGRLQFTTKLKEVIDDVELVFSAVGTPPDEDGSADLKYVLNVAREFGQNIKRYTVLVTKSTVPVGTAAKVKNVITLDIEQLAKDNEIPRSANVILLGAAQKALGIEYEKLENAIRRVFGRKGDAVVDANLKALAIGKEAQR